jgi:hypothetical protein
MPCTAFGEFTSEACHVEPFGVRVWHLEQRSWR